MQQKITDLIFKRKFRVSAVEKMCNGIWQRFKKLRDVTCFKRNQVSKLKTRHSSLVFFARHLKMIRGCCWSIPLTKCGL